jgi:hypothetical protein
MTEQTSKEIVNPNVLQLIRLFERMQEALVKVY